MSESIASDRPALDRDAILRVALELMETTGLDGLSTRRLATELGVKGPSLYWHFRNMGELRDHMAEALLRQALPAAQPAGDWRDWLAEGARAIRRAGLSRRDAARLLAGARPTASGRAQRTRANLARLEAEGFAPDDAAAAFLCLARYALGTALAEQDGEVQASDAVFEFGLRSMLDGIGARRDAP